MVFIFLLFTKWNETILLHLIQVSYRAIKKTNKHRCSLTLFSLPFLLVWQINKQFLKYFHISSFGWYEISWKSIIFSIINFEPSFTDKSCFHFSIRLVEIITNKAMNHNKSTYIGNSKRFVTHSYENVKEKRSSNAITFKTFSKQIMSKHCCYGIRRENEIIPRLKAAPIGETYGCNLWFLPLQWHSLSQSKWKMICKETYLIQ